MSSAQSSRSPPGRAGFTLVEVLIALIVALALGAGLVRFFAGVRGDAQRLRDGLDAWTVARAVLDGIPSGAAVAPGTVVGATGAFTWRLEAMPLPLPVAVDSVFQIETEEPDEPPQRPMRLRVVVDGPRGGNARLETVRLTRAGGADE